MKEKEKDLNNITRENHLTAEVQSKKREQENVAENQETGAGADVCSCL